MKLYATVTSERASKGQGGNDYLTIVVRNKEQQCIGHIKFYPTGSCKISILKEIDTSLDKPLWIGTDDDIKTKKEVHNPRTCEDSVPCFDCEAIDKENVKRQKGEQPHWDEMDKEFPKGIK